MADNDVNVAEQLFGKVQTGTKRPRVGGPYEPDPWQLRKPLPPQSNEFAGWYFCTRCGEQGKLRRTTLRVINGESKLPPKTYVRVDGCPECDTIYCFTDPKIVKIPDSS